MKLSVIIPAYNVEGHIGHTLESLAGQTSKEFETIVVDDGSTDGTGQAVQDFIDRGKLTNCRLIRTPNGGVSAARNKGVEEALGDYVMFLDGDDHVDPAMVESFVRAVEDGAPDIVCWKWLLVDENGKQIYDFYRDIRGLPEKMSGEDALRRILVERTMRIWTASAAYSKAMLEEGRVAYAAGCINGEDQEYTFKALARASNVVFIEKVLSFYLQRSTSISSVYNVKKFDYADAFKRAAEVMRGRPELEDVRDTLLSRHMLENYFYNLKTCLGSTGNVSIRALLQDIDKHYPRLNEEMRLVMKRQIKEHGRVNVQIRSFLIAPELYLALLGFRQAAIRIKAGIRSRLRHAAA
ncbi:glycosyltransferase involved in cell wall biosynthesis [Paenibacillus forsythiae]|uniref:Glycosyltransferase involved in cell wall biosynthesis n=1 Tax=Paenibacillus forsythiae TaxID=365616 RepID=A0ABU3H843_9BACL|nr:glycosyltransferase family 2 protein [Paenibacillus forsythiae]MDT3427003.1 glycosyltransferase involved in cell wall biosynthesis [Paenibacillus forsythiae]